MVSTLLTFKVMAYGPGGKQWSWAWPSSKYEAAQAAGQCEVAHADDGSRGQEFVHLGWKHVGQIGQYRMIHVLALNYVFMNSVHLSVWFSVNHYTSFTIVCIIQIWWISIIYQSVHSVLNHFLVVWRNRWFGQRDSPGRLGGSQWSQCARSCAGCFEVTQRSQPNLGVKVSQETREI